MGTRARKVGMKNPWLWHLPHEGGQGFRMAPFVRGWPPSGRCGHWGIGLENPQSAPDLQPEPAFSGWITSCERVAE